MSFYYLLHLTLNNIYLLVLVFRTASFTQQKTMGTVKVRFKNKWIKNTQAEIWSTN